MTTLGPSSLPLFGNCPQIFYCRWTKKPINDLFNEYKKKYGPVFTFWVGPFPVVLICDFDMATDAFVKKGQSFAERWEPPIFAALNDGLGLVSSSGDYWVEQKRFTLHVLRNLGVSRNLMEERILEEFHLRLDNISPNEIIDADSLFGLITANILNRVLFSYSFDDKNLEFYFESKRKHEEHYKILGFYHLCLPKWVVKTPFLRSTLDTLMEPILESKHFVRANITERIRAIKDGTREIGEDPSDYVDSFLLHMDKLRKESGEDDSSFNLETLVANVFDLYEAGQNSTSRTLSLGFFYLLHNPRLVKKIREELRNATGGTRDVLQSDKPRTPWLNAAINEALRLHVVGLINYLPVNFLRKASDDIQVGGVTIRKGQFATSLYGSIMYDGKYFENAAKFDPDRYFASDGKLESHVVSFGMGKRACIGESLARAELYLILANLIQHFELEPVDDNGQPMIKNPDTTYQRLQHYKFKLTRIE